MTERSTRGGMPLTRKGFIGTGFATTLAGLAIPATAAASEDLKRRRLEIVRRHMKTENEDAFKRTLRTFESPRYEFIATGEVDSGRKEVAGYYDSMRTGFPDQHTSDWRLRYAPGEGDNRDAVVVEFLFTGTHKGTFMGIPPTGKRVACRMTAFFFFPDGSDRLDDERVYFDAGTILIQMGVIAKFYPGWTGPLPH